MNKGEIIIYQTPDGNTQLDVKLDGETVWINRQQMAELFDRDVKTIGKHIKNALQEELNEIPTVANFATVQKEGKRLVERQVEYYNLDMIISIGYRVKSNRGVQFRIWANKILKDYLIKGFAVNQQAKVDQLQQALSSIKVLTEIATRSENTIEQAKDILQVIKDFTYALDTLDRYDYQTLEANNTTQEETFRATYDNAIEAIKILREKFGSGGFANEKDQSFKSSINTIYQTFGGEDLYPSIEEKAAMLLYLVVKNHSFSDGNKRIAAFLFLWFLDSNNILYKKSPTTFAARDLLILIKLKLLVFQFCFDKVTVQTSNMAD
ncbi:Fic family protein [Bacteroides sp. 519]|uniref:Fic family protein n=1 Tax=Bacteroides sp. 519 TaxID=2302937 RepID=UPI0013CFD52C|nr:Fic family protein [Bacteroides sp. 519]NDV57580.1 cytochrome C biogenesis protein CycH [Bacteroides sp. 519]